MVTDDELLAEAKTELAMQQEALIRYRNFRDKLAKEGYSPLGIWDAAIMGTEATIKAINDYIALFSNE